MRYRFVLFKVIKFITTLLIGYLLLFSISIMRVRSNSMAPGINDGDILLVLKRPLFAVRNRQIVVFTFPGAENVRMVKRVVGVPGDNISFTRGVVGHSVGTTDSYSALIAKHSKDSILIPQGEYFMISDNYVAGLDSRHFGLIPEVNVIGTVIAHFGINWR